MVIMCFRIILAVTVCFIASCDQTTIMQYSIMTIPFWPLSNYTTSFVKISSRDITGSFAKIASLSNVALLVSDNYSSSRSSLYQVS